MSSFVLECENGLVLKFNLSEVLQFNTKGSDQISFLVPNMNQVRLTMIEEGCDYQAYATLFHNGRAFTNTYVVNGKFELRTLFNVFKQL